LLFLTFFIVNCSNNENSIPGLTALEDAPDLQVVENTEPLHEGQFWSLSAELKVFNNQGTFIRSFGRDGRGYIWVQRYRLPWQETAEWDILDSD